MSNPIPINIATEDIVSEEVTKKILTESGNYFAIGTCYRRNGFGYLRSNIRGFNNAANGTPFIVLTDLDTSECANNLIQSWLPIPQNRNLIFRVAIREVESWLLAHRSALSAFFGVDIILFPLYPDLEQDPKRCLINLASRSRFRRIREGIAPKPGSTAQIGPDYNGILGEFIRDHWCVNEAINNSQSLDRAYKAVNNFSYP